MSKDSILPAFSGNISSTIQASTYIFDKGNVFSGAVVDFVLQTTKDEVLKISRLQENWDGNGSAKPDSVAIQRAISLLRLLYDSLSTQTKKDSIIPWRAPHVSASEDGEVVFEWWHKKRKLTMYIGVTSTQFIRVWGANIEDEMADGVFSGNEFDWLWLWLHNLNANA